MSNDAESIVAQKLAIRAFVRELGIPYTFIDVGWWMQLILPPPTSSPLTPLVTWSRERLGTGNVKNAVTSYDDIGHFVAHIIVDPRTLNQHVFCWGEEVTLNEAYAVGDRVSGENLSEMIVPVRGCQVYFGWVDGLPIIGLGVC